MKHLPYILAFAALLFSCGRSSTMRGEELEEQKQQWITQINETFSAYTQDTVELRRRLDHYLETGNKIGQVQTYRILGVQARYASQFQRAIELHTAGLDVAREIADTVNITILLNDLATDFRRIGAYNEAAPYSYLALQIAEQYRGPEILPIQRNMASAYNGIGNVYLPMGEEDEAMKAFEKALELDSHQNNHWGIAVNLSNIGSIHFSRKEYELAEDYYRRSMKHNEQANQLVGTALGHINLGELFQAQNRLDDALVEYTLAYDVLKESTDQLHWLDACFHIANIHIREGHLVQATPYLEEGLRKAREIGSFKHLSRAHQLYSTYNYAKGDYRRSVNDLRTVQTYNDTIRRNQESERLLESRITYENERHTREIEELDRINKQQKADRDRTIMMLIPVIALLVVLWLFALYRRKLARRQATEVKKLERMRSNFFTNMTHEFRTPLTIILGYSDKLHEKFEKEKYADPADVEKLKQINSQGNNLLNLVNNLLEFARSESGKTKLMWRQGDMAMFIRAVAEPYEKMAQSKQISLSVVSYTGELEMNYAPEAIKTVFGNLLANSVNHTPSGGRIEMFLRPDGQGKWCVFTVRDNGEGIAPENLPKIFELYYTSHTAGTGSGIGLALTKQLVEEMGGTIDVTSTPGKGTEFTVSLPIELTEIPEDQRAQATDDFTPLPISEDAGTGGTDSRRNPEPGNIENDGKKIILVVEDNSSMAKYISTVLGDRYVMLHARNGNEGLQMAEKYVPDLIVTDVMMPKKDGHAFTADIRASVAVSHIPIIMLTAKATDDDRIEGFKTGADAYLTKPFNEEELIVLIKRLLANRAMMMEAYSGALLAGGFENGNGCDISEYDRDFIARLSMLINSHIDDDSWFPDGLAGEMCLSRSQLYRKVKAMTGSTVFSFIMDARMQRAKLLLSKGGQSIKEVAFACGFSDMSYFSRSFKNAFGCTPSQYLKTTE